jgi:Na+/proline symporter
MGLAIAAAGIQSFGAVVGNDGIYRVRDQAALTSRRLAIARALSIALIALTGSLLASTKIDPQSCIVFALLLSASTFGPLFVLTLWPRAGSIDAIVAILVGLITAEFCIRICLLFCTRVSIAERFAGSAVLACAIAVVAGVASGLMRGGKRTDGKAFLHAILFDETELLHPDKGA